MIHRIVHNYHSHYIVLVLLLVLLLVHNHYTNYNYFLAGYDGGGGVFLQYSDHHDFSDDGEFLPDYHMIFPFLFFLFWV